MEASESSSNSDEYYEDDEPQTFLARCKLLPRALGDWSGAMAEVFGRLVRKVRTFRSNSEERRVELEDIRGVNPLHLRKSSCSCELCGSQRLAQQFTQTLLPKRELPHSVFPVSAQEPHRATSPCANPQPVFLNGRISLLVTENTTKVYVPPPATPALEKFLSSFASRQIPCSHPRKRPYDCSRSTQSHYEQTLSTVADSREPLQATHIKTRSVGGERFRRVGNVRSVPPLSLPK